LKGSEGGESGFEAASLLLSNCRGDVGRDVRSLLPKKKYRKMMHSEPARRYVMALFRRRLRETAMACEGKRYISGMRRRVCEGERGSVSPREGVAGCVV
jgi:hypothetical protein